MIKKIYVLILVIFPMQSFFCRQTHYEVHLSKVYTSTDTLFLQARSAVGDIRKSSAAWITMSLYGKGTHAFTDFYWFKSNDSGKTWNGPALIPSLSIHHFGESFSRSFGDVTPQWHQKSGTLLCTGKSFFFTRDVELKVDIKDMTEIAYAVYNPSKEVWSNQKTINLPQKLINGDVFYCVNAGCTQRWDLSNGDVLLPIRYVKIGTPYMVSTVIKCSFDGDSLRYIAHGSTHFVEEGRGLYEPSMTFYKGMYFLTLRSDTKGYVTKSIDGLNFEKEKEWLYDNGLPLNNYNTQQHWISNSHGLFLIYTRKGETNNHIFRHRAPLYMAQVDTKKLKIMQSTEKVIMEIPENNGDYGNFGVTKITENEFWITVAVMPPKLDEVNRATTIQTAVIKWKKRTCKNK